MGYKEGGKHKEYPIYHDSKRFASEMKKKFPDPLDQQAIDSYVSLIDEHLENADTWMAWRINDVTGLLKLIPLPVAKLLIKLGFVKKMNKHLTKQRTTSDVIKELTDNKDLQTIFTYCWQGLGSPPKDSSFLTHA